MKTRLPTAQFCAATLESVPQRDSRVHVFGEGQRGFSGFSRAKEALADLTLYDLRRTADTIMGDKLDVLPHVTEAVLNHVGSHASGKAGVASIYNRATYMNLKRAALDLWAGHLKTILAQATVANVTRLRWAPTE